ncbi:fatty acid desaturase-domain-containing protein [Schizophyllum commune]
MLSDEISCFHEDALPSFTQMPWSLQDVRASIPPRLFRRSTPLSLYFLLRDILMAACAWKAAAFIDPLFRHTATLDALTPFGAMCARWACWGVYWWFQSLIFTGIWVIGHECGHGAFSDYKLLNDAVGFITHTLLWTPYFSWKISHHRHRSNRASTERDEVYVPETRADLGLPPADEAWSADYDEILGDTPLYTLFMLVRQQLVAFPAYLPVLFSVSGQKTYPKSILFTPEQRNAVLSSNAGIGGMIIAVISATLARSGREVLRHSLAVGDALISVPFIPLLIMITYLYLTTPELLHYRGKAWNFQRATVDRPFLGWQGRFFLHDVAHFHVVHHFFPNMPFYHGEEATKYLQGFIGEHYAYSGKPIFKALWENYNRCQFVEDEGSVLFYRDRQGRAARRAVRV